MKPSQSDPRRQPKNLFRPLLRVVLPAMLLLIVFFSIAGYRAALSARFTTWDALHSALSFGNDRAAHNGWLVAARFLSLLLIPLALIFLFRRRVSRFLLLRHITRHYTGHVIVTAPGQAGLALARDLIGAGHFVIIHHPDPMLSLEAELLQDAGAILLREAMSAADFFNASRIAHAKACFICADSDEENLGQAQLIETYMHRSSGEKAPARESALRLITLVQSGNALQAVKDLSESSRSDALTETELFNPAEAAAQALYDQYRPDKYFYSFERDAGNAIAIVGWNAIAEAFLLENLVLGHYPGNAPLTIYILDANAERIVSEFLYRHPYATGILNIVGVRLLNASFSGKFSLSKEIIAHLAHIRAAYFFGDKDETVLQAVRSFRQFLYTETMSLGTIPLIACLPQNLALAQLRTGSSEMTDLSDGLQRGLNIHLYHFVDDTFTASRLLEQASQTERSARIINYFYSITHEFTGIAKQRLSRDLPDSAVRELRAIVLQPVKQHDSLIEREIEHLVVRRLADILGEDPSLLTQHFSVRARWNSLNYRKRDSNRYVARHMPVKLHYMKWMQCRPLNQETISAHYPRLAAIEHARWCSEKLVSGFRYGELPASGNSRRTAKELLKIHDQLVGFDALTETEKQKDLELYLLIPALRAVREEQVPGMEH